MVRDTSQTVERALRLLQTFSRDCPAIAPSDLSRSLDLPRTIVLRILNTLEQAGFVERLPGDSRYRLGVAAFEVGARYAAANPILAVADEELARLVDRTGYTAYLGVLDHHDAVIVSRHEGHHPVRFIWSVGDRLPATTTALAKAILVHMDASELDHILGAGPLSGLTDRSIVMRSDLDRDLQEARERGWTRTEEESFPGVSALGAAIFDASSRPIAGISISFLNYPEDAGRVEHLGRAVCEAAGIITTRVAGHSLYGQRSVQHSLIKPQQDDRRIPLATANGARSELETDRHWTADKATRKEERR